MSKLIVHTDGGARGNPGRAGIGALITTEEGKVLTRLSRTIGQTTNNVAEYSAVVAALVWIKENVPTRLPARQVFQCNNPPARSAESRRAGEAGVTMIQFFLDSTLVVNQLNGLFRVKDANLRNLMVKVRELEQEVGGNVMYIAIPREENQEADALVNQALDGIG